MFLSELGLPSDVSKEPISKWSAIERSRSQRFGKQMTSGRGQSGSVPAEVLRAARSPQSAFRVTGLAYHAWEQKLKEKHLPTMPVLENLRRINAVDTDTINQDVMSVLCNYDTLAGAFLSMYCRHGSMEDAQNVLQSKAMPWLQVLAEKLRDGSYTFPSPMQLEPKSMNVPKYDGTMHENPIWWHKVVPDRKSTRLNSSH